MESNSVTAAYVNAASREDLAAERIALRRRVLEWRDHWSIEAELRLRAVAAGKTVNVVAQIQELSYKDLALARAGYGSVAVVAEVVDAASKAADSLLNEAGAALTAITAHHLQIVARAGAAMAAGGFDASELIAVGKTAAPIAAAAGLGVALPALATTSSVALFGLITTSTVSVPILAAGIGGVAALSALGVVSFSGLRADQERRLIEAIDAELETRLFAPMGEGSEPSLLAALEAGFAHAADDLTGRS